MKNKAVKIWCTYMALIFIFSLVHILASFFIKDSSTLHIFNFVLLSISIGVAISFAANKKLAVAAILLFWFSMIAGDNDMVGLDMSLTFLFYIALMLIGNAEIETLNENDKLELKAAS